MLVIRLRDLVETKEPQPPVHLQFDPFVVHPRQRAQERTPPLVLFDRPHANLLSQKIAKMLRLSQAPADARRRDLQGVTPRHDVVCIHDVAEQPAHRSQIVERHPTADAVQVESQHQTPALTPVVDVDNLQPGIADERLRQLPDPLHNRSIHPLQNEKVGRWPTFDAA
jgi:hypothetical protein